ncbi:uncharacterized protein LOC116134460 isoform X2 [Pistacia vera]|uniref:uncharacterized protein LOC116134460 isoform X2 n=1 Tax=Pistacia vera TaxID=55513 RepID=UPI001262C74D|nr:uncharacterized protein LOC116134460 isoform X2 [Pistacia vera]
MDCLESSEKQRVRWGDIVIIALCWRIIRLFIKMEGYVGEQEKMLFNFDKLVSVIGWLIAFCGLLAFHQALVSNPQDAFVIWVFVSVLYNGKWEEVVKIARERAKDQVNFAPEISGFLKLNQMKNLSELASLVQDCVNALNETHSGMVYVSMKWDGCWSNFLMHW